MGSRTDLQALLETLLGSENVYFQPPPGFQMVYPCIVFKLSGIETIQANNRPYKHERSYMVTVIDSAADSTLIKKLLDLKQSKFDRSYQTEGLYHSVFTIFY
jgi:hypothetical protein